MSISSQIHTLITAAVSAADAGHTDDAAVLLQEALDHDFMAEIAMALYALECGRGSNTPVDLRPHLNEIVALPAPDGIPGERRRAITGDHDDDAFDFFGSELIVDMGAPDSNARIITPDFDQPATRRPSSALRKTIEAVDHTAAATPFVADHSASPAAEPAPELDASDPFARLVDDLSVSSSFTTRPPVPFAPAGFGADDAFEELDDLDDLQYLDDFDAAAVAAGTSQLAVRRVGDAAPGIDVPSDDSVIQEQSYSAEHPPVVSPPVPAPVPEDPVAGIVEAAMRGEVTRARYAAVAPAPPPPTHRRSPTHRASDAHEISPPDAHNGPPVTGLPLAPRGTTEANPIVAHTQEHQEHDDLDDFDLFGEAPATQRQVSGTPAEALPDKQAAGDEPARPYPQTMSGMPQTFKTSPLSPVLERPSVEFTRNPVPAPGAPTDMQPRSVLTPVRPMVAPEPSPDVSPSSAAANAGSPEPVDFERRSGAAFSQRNHSLVRHTAGETSDRGARRELHGAGTYSATGISESTDGRKHPKFRLAMTTVLKKRPLSREQRQQLNPRSMFLLDQVDGSASVADLIDISGLPAADAMELIQLLLHDNMVEAL